MSKGAELTIDAEYAMMVQPFISKEETRYYLNGFWVQPHKSGGAIVVATDGHTMVACYDRFGKVDVPGIIQLSKTTLAACKRGKNETRRVLRVEADTVSIYRNWDEEQNKGVMVAAEEGVVIDGDFPDWRKVIPALPQKYGAASINGSYLRRFEKLARQFGNAAFVRAYVADEMSPVVILTDRDDFIGVVMPVRAEHKYPDWLPAVVTAETAAAAQ